MLSFEEINTAARGLRGIVLRTPVVESAALTASLGRRVVLKLESLQHGGTFKKRGVAWKVAGLGSGDRARGFVAVSGGNFGRTVADVARDIGVGCLIVLPVSAARSSVEYIRAAGSKLLLADTVEDAFAMADAVVANEGALLLDDTEDLAIVAGYATLALELIEDAPEVTDVVVSVGGGALLAGVTAALSAVSPSVRVWGGEPAGAACMTAALGAGTPVYVPVSTRISTLGVPKVSPDILDQVRGRVAGVVTVGDELSMSATFDLIEQAKVWAEPAAGCALATARTVAPNLPDGAVIAVIVCGGNATLGDMTQNH